MSLSIEIYDEELRRYAKRLNPDLGEDAYHEMVFHMLMRGKTEEGIVNIHGFYRLSIKRELYKLYRHEQAEARNISAWIYNDPVPMQVGLANGRKKLPTCRKGHEWKEETIVYIGGRRTCLICKRIREAIGARRKRAEQKHEMGLCSAYINCGSSNREVG